MLPTFAFKIQPKIARLKLKRLQTARRFGFFVSPVTLSFSTQGNRFENSMTITNLFAQFTNLRVLDLTGTDLPISRGAFSGLARLDALLIGGNDFTDMTAVDMFEGSESRKLRVLDISYNTLTALPEGQIEKISKNLEELNLTGNGLLPMEFFQSIADTSDTAYLKPTFWAFGSVKHLSLSANNWTTFDGGLLTPLTRLESVDLSCNSFVTITKNYFANIPDSVTKINISMCQDEGAVPVNIDEDAMTTMPPNLRTLILSRGNFRNWILEIFAKSSPSTRSKTSGESSTISSLHHNSPEKPTTISSRCAYWNTRKVCELTYRTASCQHGRTVRTRTAANGPSSCPGTRQKPRSIRCGSTPCVCLINHLIQSIKRCLYVDASGNWRDVRERSRRNQGFRIRRRDWTDHVNSTRLVSGLATVHAMCTDVQLSNLHLDTRGARRHSVGNGPSDGPHHDNRATFQDAVAGL